MEHGTAVSICVPSVSICGFPCFQPSTPTRSTIPRADYYTNLSLQLRLPSKAAQTYALKLAEQGSRLREEEKVPEKFPAELRAHAEDWCFEVEADLVEDKPGLWLHSSNAGIDAVCAFLQHLLLKFDPKGVVTFEWAHDCSKPRTDAYGGGAAIITAKQIKTMSTCQWLRENAA